MAHTAYSEMEELKKLISNINQQGSIINREQVALTAARIDHTTFLNRIMMKIGIPNTTWYINHPTFLKLMHTCLLDAVDRFSALKMSSASLSKASDEEKNSIRILVVEIDTYLKDNSDNRPVADSSMMKEARKKFNDELPEYLKNIMHLSRYDKLEMEDTHECYLSFFSKYLILHTERLIRYLTEISTIKRCNAGEINAGPNKRRKLNEAVTLGDGKKYALLARYTTKKYQIFFVSTSLGERLVKTLKPGNCSIKKNTNALNNEFQVSSKVQHHFLRKAFAKTTHEGRQALLLEYIPGIPIDQVGIFNTKNFLKVARDIVSVLLRFHEGDIFDLSLSCQHILYIKKSNTVKIISVGSSSSSSSKKSYVCANELLERDLRFIAPEQTGRVNRNVDHRTDFYSLGIIFYKLLSGKYPFENSDDPFSLIQMHILQEPTPLHFLDEKIPLPISNMVSKLLCKSADDRYQSANGIIHDIYLFSSEYQSIIAPNNISLDIAQHDKVDNPARIIPQKLYGRAVEYDQLLTVINRVTKSSTFELVLVKGKSGAGVYALVA